MVRFQLTPTLPPRHCFPILFVVILLLSTFAYSESSNRPWEFLLEKQGIRVERRIVTNSPLYEFRAQMTLRVPLARILAVFNDHHRISEWMKGSVEQRLLSRKVYPENQDLVEELYLYNRISPGRGASDRDVIMRTRIRFDQPTKQVFIEFDSITDERFPPLPGIVRMPFIHGYWCLKPIEQGNGTQVEYRVHSNPGGWLPTWIVNYATKTIPFDTLLGLQRQVYIQSYPGFEAMLRKSEQYQAMIAP